jgi:glycyl-tRNA synthetase
MEMEFFVPPAEAPEWYEHWQRARMDWYLGLGLREDHLRLREHEADELSHYSSGTADIEYLFPIGWSELEGIANRGNFDLTQHAEFSGEKLEYFDQASGERYVPHVIEPAAGADRATLAFLVDAYDEDTSGASRGPSSSSTRAWRPSRPRSCRWCARTASPSWPRIRAAIRDVGAQTEYDEGGSIGKRYRRQDEIGTPYCVTVDHRSLEDRTVTLRDRDSLQQERVALDALPALISARLAAPWRSPKLSV